MERGFKNDRGTDSDGTKRKRIVREYSSDIFCMNKRTFVPRCIVGEQMRESPGWADDEAKTTYAIGISMRTIARPFEGRTTAECARRGQVNDGRN